MDDDTQVDTPLDSAPSNAQPTDASNANDAQDRFHSSPAFKSLVDKLAGPDDSGTDAENSPTTPSKTATPEPEKPAAKADPPPAPAEDPDPTEDEVKTFGPGAQKRIQQLVTKRRAAEERATQLEAKAKMIDSLDESLAKAKIDRAVWDQWQQLGFLAQTEPVKAARALAQLARELDPEVVAELTKTGTKPEPKAATELDDDLQQMVDSFELAEATALKIQATRKPAAPAAATRQPAAPAAAPRAAIPRMADIDLTQGEAALKSVDDEFRQKYPTDWDKLAPEVNKLMEDYRGIAPAKWGKIARECAEKVIAKRGAAEAVDPVARTTERRHSSSPTTSRDGLAKAIADGTLFQKT